MNLKEIEKKSGLRHLLELNHGLFSILLVTFLLLLLIETIWNGIVSTYMNIDYILIIVIISGAVSLLNRNEEEKGEKDALAKRDYLYICTAGIAATLIVWYKIKDTGLISYLISVIAGVLIILLFLLLFKEGKRGG